MSSGCREIYHILNSMKELAPSRTSIEKCICFEETANEQGGSQGKLYKQSAETGPMVKLLA